jgi:hypothetical protein
MNEQEKTQREAFLTGWIAFLKAHGGLLVAYGQRDFRPDSRKLGKSFATNQEKQRDQSPQPLEPKSAPDRRPPCTRSQQR